MRPISQELCKLLKNVNNVSNQLLGVRFIKRFLARETEKSGLRTFVNLYRNFSTYII